MTNKKIAVTGAFGFSGRHIAKELLEQGHEVITLTGRPNRPNPFGEKVQAYHFNFNNPEKLVETLKGVDTLINTYWVRFNYKESTFQRAITNSRILFQAAKKAGVRKIVHTSITNPDRHSQLPYFWGKALLEEDLMNLGLSYAILRPAVLFGDKGILINNMAWFLRYTPVFGIPGNGKYQMQPIHVKDFAELAVDAINSNENQIIQAIGPETYTFEEMMKMLRKTVKSRSLLIHVPPMMAYYATKILGWVLGDVILTKDEVVGLKENRLFVDAPGVGAIKLSEWVQENAGILGKQYFNELKGHF